MQGTTTHIPRHSVVLVVLRTKPTPGASQRAVMPRMQAAAVTEHGNGQEAPRKGKGHDGPQDLGTPNLKITVISVIVHEVLDLAGKSEQAGQASSHHITR
jgi:hypothetical protein